MKVALVNRFFHRAGAVPTVAREWAEQLEAAGHEALVFASDVDASASTARRHYVPVRLGRIKAFDLAGFAFARRLIPALRRFGAEPPDVVLAFDSTAYFGAWRAGKALRRPTIMAFQGWIYSPGKRGIYPFTVTWAYKRAVRFCARRAPMIACLSPEIHDGLRAMGVPAERLWLAPNCVDLDLWRTAKDGAHRRAEREVLFVGRFSPEKGLRYLLEALHAVASRVPEIRARLVGTDEAEDGEFHALARRLGVADCVVFGGALPRAELQRIYAAADLLVVPSLAEGHPLAPLECLACGTPVVASDLPGLRQTLQDGVNGLLVPPRDPAALAEAIARVLSDEALLDRMSRAARPSVERFSWKRRIEELAALVPRLKP